MMLDPVDQASANRTKPNSCVDQRITSSPIRDRSTAIWASTKRPPPTRSRAAVPSMELATLPSRSPQLGGDVASGSSPSEVPARAAEPYGLTASRRSRSRSRSMSRSSGQAWASRWWLTAARAGRAADACGRASRRRDGVRAWSWSALDHRLDLGRRHRATARRRYSRISVAIWSLRERPARSRPPSSGPIRSISPRSSAPCTSSSVGAGPKLPETTSAASRSSPLDHPGQLVVGQQARPGAGHGHERGSRRGRTGPGASRTGSTD